MTVRGPDRPWSHEIPDGPWDYIVIGSGIGGMTAAALLASVGRRVLVLEQHTVPGGFTQMFRRPGYRWDVGVHLVGEMGEDRYLGRLISALAGGRLAWEPLGPVYDEFHFPDGFAIQFPSDPREFREVLVDRFPSESAAIDEYLSLVRSAASATGQYLQLRAMPEPVAALRRRAVARGARPFLESTTAEVLASLTSDRRLRSVLAAQWGYYGAPPGASSFAMHAMVVRHFIRGAYYPVGGAAAIAPALLQTVADARGWAAVRRPVASISTRRGRATGVRLADGTELAAGGVISTVGAIGTSRLLGEIPDGDTAGYRVPGPAHLSLYLGFRGDIERHGAGRQCQWFYRSWDLESARWEIDPARPPGRAPVLFCSFPSLKDPEHDPGPEARQTGEVITFVPQEAFASWSDTRWQRRGAGYATFKQVLTDSLLEQYQERYPGLGPLIDHVELSTPLSTEHFARAPAGSIYGLGSEPARFLDPSLGPRTGTRRLFLGGVDAATPGIAGGIGGGVFAALAAEPVRALRFVRSLMRTRPGI